MSGWLLAIQVIGIVGGVVLVLLAGDSGSSSGFG